MSFQKTSRALKNDILERCGELQDGTSPFETTVMKYLNSVYQDVLAGGSEFSPDTAEPWNWAQAEKPMPIALLPAYSLEVEVTNGDTAIMITTPPGGVSLEGRYLRIDSRADFYTIVSHTAGDQLAYIDQPYLQDSGTVNAMFFKLDYDLISNQIIITNQNNNLDFTIDGSTILTATVSPRVYTPDELALAVLTEMIVAGGVSPSCTFNSATRMFDLGQGGPLFSLLFATGPNATTSLSGPLGFDIEDYTGSLSYSSAYANSGILRLTKPITIYRDRNTFWNADKDSGKVFHIDQNTFLREYPLSRMTQDVPDKFCLLSQSPTGLTKARFNASVLDNPIRAEVNYIPVTRKLVDNDVSIPVIPGSYTDFLVYAASSLVMRDKSDTKAADYHSLAQAKLQAMVNDNRKTTQLAGNNFGRIIPRSGPPTRAPGYGY